MAGEDFDKDIDWAVLEQDWTDQAIQEYPLELPEIKVKEDEKEAGFSISKLKNWADIVQALSTVEDEHELKRWVVSRLFKPFFMAFFTKAPLPTMKTGENKVRGEDLKTILLRLQHASQSGDTRYTSYFPDQSGWTTSDYTAQCIGRVIDLNSSDRDGLFYSRNVAFKEKAKLIWRIFQLVRSDVARTCLFKQGKSILKLTDDEISSIQKQLSAGLASDSLSKSSLSEEDPPRQVSGKAPPAASQPQHEATLDPAKLEVRHSWTAPPLLRAPPPIPKPNPPRMHPARRTAGSASPTPANPLTIPSQMGQT